VLSSSDLQFTSLMEERKIYGMSSYGMRCQLKSILMLLAFDIGNTNITLGVWDGVEWLHQWRLRTIHNMTTDEYGIYLKTLLGDLGDGRTVSDIVMSSVVPPLTTTISSVCREYLHIEPLKITSDTNTGIQIKTDVPSEVGADRIVNAAAAYSLYPGPSVVVDMGTATTFDAVSKSGELLGVVIAPGLAVAADALSKRAAQLAHVPLSAPPSFIGKNTIHAMQSGLIFGYIALIEGMVARIRNEMDCPNAKVIGTGGLISRIADHTSIFDHIEPWLTLTGLKIIYLRNQV